MKIVRELPPNYEEICKTLSPSDKTVFAYGDTLYAPGIKDDTEIQDHLMIHEETHQRQQGDDVEGWWIKYIADPEFRLSQELEAYGNQYAFVSKKDMLAIHRKNFLERIAADLASPMYGNILSLQEAESKIRNRAKEVETVWEKN
jgi:hypothetical protein